MSIHGFCVDYAVWSTYEMVELFPAAAEIAVCASQSLTHSTTATSLPLELLPLHLQFALRSRFPIHSTATSLPLAAASSAIRVSAISIGVVCVAAIAVAAAMFFRHRNRQH